MSKISGMIITERPFAGCNQVQAEHQVMTSMMTEKKWQRKGSSVYIYIYSSWPGRKHWSKEGSVWKSLRRLTKNFFREVKSATTPVEIKNGKRDPIPVIQNREGPWSRGKRDPIKNPEHGLWTIISIKKFLSKDDVMDIDMTPMDEF